MLIPKHAGSEEDMRKCLMKEVNVQLTVSSDECTQTHTSMRDCSSFVALILLLFRLELKQTTVYSKHWTLLSGETHEGRLELIRNEQELSSVTPAHANTTVFQYIAYTAVLFHDISRSRTSRQKNKNMLVIIYFI